CSSASASFFLRSALAARSRSTSVLTFVVFERRPVTDVRLFVPLRDKVTSSAQSLAPFRSGYQRPSLSILTEPHDELAPFHPITSSAAIRGTGVTQFGSGLPPQSALMPANVTTLAHFSVSLARRRPKLAGGPGSIVPPISASRAFALGSARIALISMLSRPMTSGGVFLGAMMPKNALAS